MDIPQKDHNKDYNLELARLLFYRGDNLRCVDLLEPLKISYSKKSTDLYLKCINRLLRAYAELEDSQKIQELKGELNQWAREKGNVDS